VPLALSVCTTDQVGFVNPSINTGRSLAAAIRTGGKADRIDSDRSPQFGCPVSHEVKVWSKRIEIGAVKVVSKLEVEMQAPLPT
jgi:hypothetical protein